MISQELITLIYGSIVDEVIINSQHMTEANFKLLKIGERIGSKVVDEYMKEIGKPCTKLQEMVEKFVTVGMKRYLGAQDCRYDEYKLTEKGLCFNLKIINNPLLKNLQITEDLKSGGLIYQSIIQGAVKGAFEVMKFKAEVKLIYQNIKSDKNNQTIYFVNADRM